MAQIKCPDCGKEVDSSLHSCPNCGRPFKSSTGTNSFSQSSLLQDEIIISSAKWHPICYTIPVFLGIISLVFLILWLLSLSDFYSDPLIVWLVYFGNFVLFSFASVYLFFAIGHNEFVVTNKRIIIKSGIIMRMSYELKLEMLESVQVYQSIFGRLLNYGLVLVHGIGASRAAVWGIKAPLEFRQHFFQELSKRNNQLFTNNCK